MPTEQCAKEKKRLNRNHCWIWFGPECWAWHCVVWVKIYHSTNEVNLLFIQQYLIHILSVLLFLFPFPSQSNQNGKFSEKGKQYFCYRGLKCHWNLPTIFQNNFVCVCFFSEIKKNNSNKNESTFKCGKRTYWIATDVMKWVFFSTLCCYLLISHFLQSLAKSVSL